MNAKRTSPHRAYDVVLYGATGFVGRQTVAHFAAHGSGVRWALAGRSADKLEQVRQACGPGAAGAGIIVADAADQKGLDALASQAAVVLSTAGPFALHGSALVAACVAHRTHYVDITGETPWVRGLIDRHHAEAARNGTRIIPCCGFDSVPSDLGAWLVAEAIFRQHGEQCVSVKACHSMRGGLNGGTLASAFNLMESGQNRLLADPFLLNPKGTVPRNAAEHADPVAPHRDADFDAWLGPFVMGPVNTRVVRRTAALLKARGDGAYGATFRYQEYLRFGRGPLAAAAAAGVTVGIGVGMAALRFKTGRALARAVAVAPGQGPDRAFDGRRIVSLRARRQERQRQGGARPRRGPRRPRQPRDDEIRLRVGAGVGAATAGASRWRARRRRADTRERAGHGAGSALDRGGNDFGAGAPLIDLRRAGELCVSRRCAQRDDA